MRQFWQVQLGSHGNHSLQLPEASRGSMWPGLQRTRLRRPAAMPAESFQAPDLNLVGTPGTCIAHMNPRDSAVYFREALVPEVSPHCFRHSDPAEPEVSSRKHATGKVMPSEANAFSPPLSQQVQPSNPQKAQCGMLFLHDLSVAVCARRILTPRLAWLSLICKESDINSQRKHVQFCGIDKVAVPSGPLLFEVSIPPHPEVRFLLEPTPVPCSRTHGLLSSYRPGSRALAVESALSLYSHAMVVTCHHTTS